MPSKTTPWLAALLAAALPAAALATSVIAASVEEMTRAAPVVVRVAVGPSQAAWDPERRRIWTYAEVKVKEALKGTPPQALLVKQPGGEVGGVGQRVAGVARFVEGQDAVLFLEPAVDEPGTFVVYGLAEGKVDLEDFQGQLAARRHLDGLLLVHKGPPGVHPVGADGELLGTAQAFLARVRAAAKGGAK